MLVRRDGIRSGKKYLHRRSVSMVDANDLMNQCMNMMNGMIGGGVMGNSLLFVFLVVLLLVWLIGLAVLGGVGIWAYRRLRA
jgi:hypothetical protein